jgi:hypothetical protein
MAKALTVTAYLLAASLAYASSCPVMLVSGMRDVDGIVVTFRNAGKLRFAIWNLIAPWLGQRKHRNAWPAERRMLSSTREWSIRCDIPSLVVRGR